MEELRVRRIRDDEAPLLREVRLRALADAPEAFGQTVAEAASRSDDEWRQQARQSAAGDRRAWFLAEVWSAAAESRLVGIVNGRRRPPEDLLVFSMWVDPQLRRLGIGRRLIDAIDAWGHAWDARRTVLWVFAANESAIRFYRSLGFDVESEGPDGEIGRSYGALAMSRATSPGEDAEPAPAEDAAPG